jgi:hypothetical protein
VCADKAVPAIPFDKLRLRSGVGLSAEGEGLEDNLHIMTVSGLADGAEEGRAVSLAGTERPEAMDLYHAIGLDDQLHPSPAAAGAVRQGVISLANRWRDGGEVSEKVVNIAGRRHGRLAENCE